MDIEYVELWAEAAALYDGGWRSTDIDELIAEYELTEEEARAICMVLEDIERNK